MEENWCAGVEIPRRYQDLIVAPSGPHDPNFQHLVRLRLVMTYSSPWNDEGFVLITQDFRSRN